MILPRERPRRQDGDEELAATPTRFRSEALGRMAEHQPYRQAVANQMALWLRCSSPLAPSSFTSMRISEASSFTGHKPQSLRCMQQGTICRHGHCANKSYCQEQSYSHSFPFIGNFSYLICQS